MKKRYWQRRVRRQAIRVQRLKRTKSRSLGSAWAIQMKYARRALNRAKTGLAMANGRVG